MADITGAAVYSLITAPFEKHCDMPAVIKKIYARYQLRGSKTLLIPYCVKMISSYTDPKEAKDGVTAHARKWLKIRIKGQHLNALSLYLSIQNSHEGMLNHTRFHK